MANLKELTIEQACKCPQSFMYIWADEDKFLRYIDKEYADIIRVKKGNENKILDLSAEKFGKTKKDYTNAIRAAFVEAFGITPAAALVKLSNGERVAGKDWKAGVFGIGKTNSTEFKDTGVTVNPDNGYMMINGQYKPVTDTVYENGEPFQQFWYNEAGEVTYMSQKGEDGKWYAASYQDALTGKKWTASGKDADKASEAATIWQDILLDEGLWQKILDWIMSLFSGLTNKQTLTVDNTLPSQTGDGFVYKSGIGTTGALILGAVAVGTMLMGGGLGIKKSKK